MIRSLCVVLCGALLVAPLVSPASARDLVGLRVWHGVDGWAGVELERLVVRFNASQKEYRVVTEYTGDAQGAARDSREGEAALLVLPLRASAVLYYNRDAFRRARLDPAAPPKTWYAMAPALEALRSAGVACGYVAAAPAEMLLDQVGAGGDAERLSIDSARVRWVAMLATWRKAGYFTYERQAQDAERRFAEGECALLTAHPSRQADLRAAAAFELGVAPLPGYDEPAGARRRGAVGAWLLPGRSEDEYRGVGRLLAFFARPEVQAEWRRRTGYASLAPAAYDLAALREAVEQELEAAWSGTKAPLDALNAAVQRGNALLHGKQAQTATVRP